MSCKLSPWGASTAVRNLSIRTRRTHTTSALRAAAARPQSQTAHLPTCLVLRRGYTNDTTSRLPPGYQSDEASILASQSASGPGGGEVKKQEPRSPEVFAPNFLNSEAIDALERAAAGLDIDGEDDSGLLFSMPEKLGKHEKLQDRYHPVVDQVTKLLMRDGKLSKAQRHMSLILNYLRTSPPPRVSPLRPLLPGAPPAHQLPLNPLLYLTLAIDSVAPIIRIRSIKGAAGGGLSLDVPEPLAVRARRRTAVVWILDAVLRKRSVGSGRAQFATRFAQELVAVVEGRSPVWDKRGQVHRQGTAARANLTHQAVVGGRKKRK